MSQGTLQRFAPLTAFVFVGLVIASFVVLGETPDSDAPTDEVVIRGRITMWATAPWWMRSALSPAF